MSTLTGHEDGRVRAWAVTFMCGALNSMNFADKVIVGLAGVFIMKDLSLTPVQFGWLGSAFFFLYSIASILVGFIADKVKTKWVIAVMVTIWALTQLPMTWEVGFGVLLASRIVLGAAEGPSIAVLHHAVFKWFPPKSRGLPSAIINGGSCVGVLVAAPLLEWVIRTQGWHFAFGALGVVGLLWLPIWLIFAREGTVVDPVPAGVLAMPAARPSFWSLVTQRTFIGSLICCFFSFSVMAMVIAWLPNFLIKGEGFNPQQASWLVSLAWGINAVVTPLIGWISGVLIKHGVPTKWARGELGALFVVVGGLSFMATGAVDSFVVRIGLVMFTFALAAMIWPLHFSLISEITPMAQRGSVMATHAGLFTTAGVVAPVVMGYAIQGGATVAAGYLHGFFLMGIAAAIGGAVGALLINPEADRARLRLGPVVPVAAE